MATDSVKMADEAEVVPAKGATPPLVLVVVTPPYQVAHHGIVFRPGETAQVPEDVAAHWITCGWVVAK
jgi:hypothetical protein